MSQDEDSVVDGVATTNIVVIEGVVKSEPSLRETGDGTHAREFVVGTRIDGRIVNAPVVCAESLGKSIVEGDRVFVVGMVRTRFFAAGGRTQSRTEVVASRVAGVRSKSARTKALAEVAVHLKAM